MSDGNGTEAPTSLVQKRKARNGSVRDFVLQEIRSSPPEVKRGKLNELARSIQKKAADSGVGCTISGVRSVLYRVLGRYQLEEKQLSLATSQTLRAETNELLGKLIAQVQLLASQIQLLDRYEDLRRKYSDLLEDSGDVEKVRTENDALRRRIAVFESAIAGFQAPHSK